MPLPNKVLKKKLIISLIAIFAIGLSSLIVYIIASYYNSLMTPQKSVATQENNNDDLPAATQSIAVEVNNFIGENKTPVNKITASATQTVEAESNIIVPPLQATKITLNNKIPTEYPAVASYTQANANQSLKPKLFIGGGTSLATNSSNDTNFISQTNTTVGTGFIDTQMTKQNSPYTILAGSFIPITMQSGLNSEQRGQIVAMVSRDVYDTTNGKYLLIPQGSKVIGTYDNNVAYGQRRLLVGWNRLIYPDANATSVLLHGLPGTSLEGYSGFDGSIDNHYTEIYGSSFLIGGIMGAQAAASGNQGLLTQPTTLQTMAQQVGNQMAQTGLSVVQKGLNIPPTIIIGPGYRGYIETTADLQLKPYIRGYRK